MTSSDEKLLEPSREHLANLRIQIASLETEAVEKIKRYAADDDDLARELWHNFHLAVEPLRREQEAVVKVIVDYYAAQPLPQFIIPNHIDDNQDPFKLHYPKKPRR
jgi:hypothetical protein